MAKPVRAWSVPPEIPSAASWSRRSPAPSEKRISRVPRMCWRRWRSATRVRCGARESDVQRLLDALAGRRTDRLPHLEFWFGSKALYEHILERKLAADTVDGSSGELVTTPEDDVELARCLGMDAATCFFSWPLPTGSVRGWADLDRLRVPPHWLTNSAAWRDIWTSRGAPASGSSPASDRPLRQPSRAIGATDDTSLLLGARPSLAETLMDIVLEHQVRVAQAVCRSFCVRSCTRDGARQGGDVMLPDSFRPTCLPRCTRSGCGG